MSPRLRRLVLSALTVFATAGCSVLPRHMPPPRYHDFGPFVPPASLTRISVSLDRVKAPPWLRRDTIWYRFLAGDPTQLRAYAENRWIAPPPTLIAQAVGARLPEDRRPRYRLRLGLERFEQDFVGRKSAVTVVRVRAVLFDRNGAVSAQRVFALSAPAATTVDGAIGGLSTLGERAVQEILEWASKVSGASP